MLEVSAVCGTIDAITVHETPYRWATTPDDALGTEATERLEAEFPTAGFARTSRSAGTPGEKSYVIDSLPLVDGTAFAPAFELLSDHWRDLVHHLVGGDYRRRLGARIGCDLHDSSVEVRATRYDRHHHMSAHTDRSDKLVTQIWYFNAGWRASWGGQLDVLGSNDDSDVVASVAPGAGSSVVIVRSARSWHRVRPVAARSNHVRRSLLVHYRKA